MPIRCKKRQKQPASILLKYVFFLSEVTFLNVLNEFFRKSYNSFIRTHQLCQENQKWYKSTQENFLKILQEHFQFSAKSSQNILFKNTYNFQGGKNTIRTNRFFRRVFQNFEHIRFSRRSDIHFTKLPLHILSKRQQSIFLNFYFFPSLRHSTLYR